MNHEVEIHEQIRNSNFTTELLIYLFILMTKSDIIEVKTLLHYKVKRLL